MDAKDDSTMLLPSKDQILACIKIIESKIKDSSDESDELKQGIVKEKERMEDAKVRRIEAEKAQQKAMEEAKKKKALEEEEQARIIEKEKEEERMLAEAKRCEEEERKKAEEMKRAQEPTPVTPMVEETHDVSDDDDDDGSDLPIILDNSGEMQNLIDDIVAQNRKRALEAQEESLNLLPKLPSQEALELNKKELARLGGDNSKELFHSNAEWTQLTRDITGPGDALYTSPDENPFFAFNEATNDDRKHRIAKVVHGKKKLLRKRWEELGYQYAAQMKVYNNAKSKGKDDVSTKSAASSSSRGSGEAPKQSSYINPYRRPRRANGMGGLPTGDVVRSEYEQEQIIAELAAKEEMERRIKNGICDVPRQICQAERVSCLDWKQCVSYGTIIVAGNFYTNFLHSSCNTPK